jgi:predicted O-methyltransferase YrrM
MATQQISKTPLSKLRREVSRPFQQLARGVKRVARPKHVPAPVVVISPPPASIANFHPQDCTVEPEGVALLQELVRESKQFPGPIIEVGTLVGITATYMALAKSPEQKIITVDAFCWNPWGLSPDVHEALARQLLQYPIAKGEVQLIRGDKNEYYRNYKGPAPALVFLDAMHDYEETKKDIEWAKRVGAKIISGHDYCDKFPGVIKVVDEFGGPRRLGGTVWAL